MLWFVCFLTSILYRLCMRLFDFFEVEQQLIVSGWYCELGRKKQWCIMIAVHLQKLNRIEIIFSRNNDNNDNRSNGIVENKEIVVLPVAVLLLASSFLLATMITKF